MPRDTRLEKAQGRHVVLDAMKSQIDNIFLFYVFRLACIDRGEDRQRQKNPSSGTPFHSTMHKLIKNKSHGHLCLLQTLL